MSDESHLISGKSLVWANGKDGMSLTVANTDMFHRAAAEREL